MKLVAQLRIKLAKGLAERALPDTGWPAENYKTSCLGRTHYSPPLEMTGSRLSPGEVRDFLYHSYGCAAAQLLISSQEASIHHLELMESSVLDIERKLSERLCQAAARAAKEFEGAPAHVSDRQFVRLVENMQILAREVVLM